MPFPFSLFLQLFFFCQFWQKGPGLWFGLICPQRQEQKETQSHTLLYLLLLLTYSFFFLYKEMYGGAAV